MTYPVPLMTFPIEPAVAQVLVRPFSDCRFMVSSWEPDEAVRRQPGSGGNPFLDGPAAQVRALQGRGQVGGLVGRADVGPRRDDLVDPVEDLVAERDVDAGQQVVELLH